MTTPLRRRLLPGVVLALLLVLAGVRLHASLDERDAPVALTSVRQFGDARLEVPRDWVTLDRTREHVTWGEPSRAHTVTLAATDMGGDALPAVVDAAAAQSAQELPGLEREGRPIEVALAHAAAGDSAMLARFHATGGRGDGDLLVAQAWRRDTRGSLDLVATWTSLDGTWPADPREAIPFSTTSR